MSNVVLRKQNEKADILAALKLKELRGSIVKEMIKCGKRGCKCQTGVLHGPYAYLHFYSAGKVKRKYLSKALGELMSYPREELETMLQEAEQVLGHGKEDALK
jgi:hypothetical protein